MDARELHPVEQRIIRALERDQDGAVVRALAVLALADPDTIAMTLSTCWRARWFGDDPAWLLRARLQEGRRKVERGARKGAR